MEFLDKVEKLRAKANISYEEAKQVLTETDGDLLDAMILLERQGRITPPVGAPSSPGPGAADTASEQEPDTLEKIIRWIKSLFRRGNRNSLQIRRRGEIIASMPVTVFVAALFFATWVTVPLMIAGLFCGCSYSFRGPDLEKESINKAWDKASEMAESIKEDIRRESRNQ